MESPKFLQDLTIVMTISGISTVVFRILKQPPVLGYILAGLFIGPHLLPYPLVSEQVTIQMMAELGVIFMMFTLGLEFSLRKFSQVGITALFAAVFEIVLMLWLGFQLGKSLGWKTMDSLFLGAILSISSTTIIIRTLKELEKTKERFAQVVFGILVVEDILGIVLLAVLSSIIVAGSIKGSVVLGTMGKLGLFLTLLIFCGFIFIPKILRYIAKFKNKEALLITSLSLCFGISYVASKLNFSVALGAFFTGAIIADTKYSNMISEITEPIRDMFGAVFFVSMGMMLDMKALSTVGWPIILMAALVVVGKGFACSFGTFIAGRSMRSSLKIGLCTTQIGEFSFIIATLGATSGVTSSVLYPTAIAVSALTTMITPQLVKNADSMIGFFRKQSPRVFVDSLDIYSRWIGRLRANEQLSHIWNPISNHVISFFINIALISTTFITSAVLSKIRPRFVWVSQISANIGGYRGFFWLMATLISMPMIMGALRSAKNIAVVISDLASQITFETKESAKPRRTVSLMIFSFLVFILLLFMGFFSAMILPPSEIPFIVIVSLFVIVMLLRKSFVQLYVRAEQAIENAIHNNSRVTKSEKDMHGILNELMKDQMVWTVEIAEKSFAIGKKLGDLQIRAQTGASVLAIDRQEQRVVNPSPEIVLKVKDTLLVVGDKQQLSQLKSYLKEEGLTRFKEFKELPVSTQTRTPPPRSGPKSES